MLFSVVQDPMATATTLEQSPIARLASNSEPDRKIKFAANNGFQVELRRRVEAYCQSTGLKQRDCWQMYLKTGILLTCFVAAYLTLLLVVSTWWQALPVAVFLGICTAGIGFNIQHDGGHQGYSNRRWVNKLASVTLDLIGGSSYIWHWKHGVYHHTYPNVAGHDSDIDLGVLGRLSPHQKHHAFHRFQHFYLWPLYGLLAIKWHLIGDFRDIITGKIGGHKVPRPKGWDLVVFIGGKIAFFMLAFGLPMMLHPVLSVLAIYGVAALVLGLFLSVVFQLAHCVEEAEFPIASIETGRIEHAWAIHQVETTVNFGRRNRIMAWFLGGLNFQIEHHLLPKICHVNYRAISDLVETTCHEFGIKYHEHRTFWRGLVSHYRWLREMGRANAV